MKNGIIAFWIGIALLIVGGIGFSLYSSSNGSTVYNGVAQCLKDKGVVFYGAFWCPHCQKTKAMFGAAAKLLPYVECSTPDAQSQTQICKDNKIESYPTWVYPDGSRLNGERTIKELADKAGCALPQ